MFTDTHSHIHFAQHFPDIEALLERATDADVTRQIIVGCTPKDSYQALDFVQAHADFSLWSTLGVHPHNADECTPEVLARFQQLIASEKKIVALGEMGLDYFRNFKPRDIQHHAFRAQLGLAKRLDLPVIVHIRDAWDDAFEILKEEGNNKVILHCFSGNLEQARLSWERGYFISFAGVLTYPQNHELREIGAQTPQDLFLIETDCPYLTPQKYRGKRNEPAFLVETAKELAKIREISFDQIAEQTTHNALKIFKLLP